MLKNFKTKKITGKKIRTNNNKINEIVDLWKEISQSKLSGDIYAVYFNYESDFNGDYDLLIGSDNSSFTDFIDIKEGKYAVWEVESNSPESVGKAWHNIWNSDIDRLYDTDFELYSEDGTIKIYIGIKN